MSPYSANAELQSFLPMTFLLISKMPMLIHRQTPSMKKDNINDIHCPLRENGISLKPFRKLQNRSFNDEKGGSCKLPAPWRKVPMLIFDAENTLDLAPFASARSKIELNMDFRFEQAEVFSFPSRKKWGKSGKNDTIKDRGENHYGKKRHTH